MMKIALIRETKVPSDNRVALTPPQCKWISRQFPHVKIIAQRSSVRCFTDAEYRKAEVDVCEDVSDADLLIGIKEVSIDTLEEGKTYMFFSHTKKKQPHNRSLLQAILKKKIRLIDFECLEHEDGQRIIGFGFFAGIVGAHNGMMAYGNRTGAYKLERVYKQKDFRSLMHTYFGLKVPNIKIAVTGSGRVAHGILEIMNLMGIIEVEKEEYLQREFSYPAYVHLKGADLYEHKSSSSYQREEFHLHPERYQCRFAQYAMQTDVLMNGVYWMENVPRLFTKEDVGKKSFRIQTIADITDDVNGSVPLNCGDGTMEEPVYGIDRISFLKTPPYLPGSVDLMAVGNLPNELPRDASRYFGEQLIKYVLPDLLSGGSRITEKATLTRDGALTEHFEYLKDYAA